MDFAWDDAKHERNLRERGFGFDVAALIFDGPTVEEIDRRHDDGAVRMRAVGAVGDNVDAVDDTDREDCRRIISALRAKRRERLHWLESL